MTTNEPFAAVVDGVHILPVFHERLEAADQVRRAFDTFEFDAVAVEVPASLERAWLSAVGRLPAISVVLYETARRETVYLPVHPADPMVEAARSATERGLKLACADLDVDGYADYRDPVPDPYALLRLGPSAVWRAFREHPRQRDPRDGRRESAMAFHVQQLRDEGAERILLVCGMHHVEGLVRALEAPQGIPLAPPVRRNVRVVHLHPDSLGETLGEMPFYISVYERRRRQLPREPVEDFPVAAGKTYGPFRVLTGGRGDDPDRLATAIDRSARGAGWSSWRGFLENAPVGADPANDETVRPGPLDRLRLQWSLLREAEGAVHASALDEKIEAWQRRNLARFARNLARVSGQLVVDLYDLIVAARGCVTENFAYELHRMAIAYPAQAETATDVPTARIRAEEIFDGVRRIRLTRRLPRRKGRGPESLFGRRRRRDEEWAGEWLEKFDGEVVCSYPPEDVIIEEFGQFLKKRGKALLSEEAARTVPFTTSVLDGIDVRETIRHWTEKTIYVREAGRVPGDVGPVVVIFDEDRDSVGEERYPYQMTWLGEHDQESDMAFYATRPEQGIVGPGICRVTYGGFLLSYPPGRLLPVWSDADYRFAETKPEVLLLAALDYARESIIVHVAARPPRPIFHQIAARLRLKILHVPIGTLSPSTVRKIRVMHVLSGHDKRKIARDYVW
jgi:hypothetical protein